MHLRRALLIVLAAAFVTAFGASLSLGPSRCMRIQPNAVTGKSWCAKSYDSGLIGSRETALLEELGVALEEDNSQEISRIDSGQRIFGMDRTAIRSKTRPDAAGSVRRDISPPLLV